MSKAVSPSQGRVAIRYCLVDGSVQLLAEAPHHRNVPLLSGDIQGCAAILACLVNVSVQFPSEAPHHREVPATSDDDQGWRPLVCLVDGSVQLLDQAPHHRNVLLLSDDDQGRVAILVLDGKTNCVTKRRMESALTAVEKPISMDCRMIISSDVSFATSFASCSSFNLSKAPDASSVIFRQQ